ncbi:MAG: hypothetical protein HW380_3480 [Magnetococcales bacterium]|nr:hypothetical protein [Magnetococcales bacterium]HIJ85792.1 NAC family transcription factor [Magnetococcales bacterium]
MVTDPNATVTLTKTAGGTAAKVFPAKLVSGKIFSLSLGAVNPWILLGLGAVGGYFYCRKKRFSFF